MNIQTGIYQHYKDDKYHLIGVAKHSETLEEFAVYKALYQNSVSQLWVRPTKLFTNKVEWQGKKMPHFKLLKPQQGGIAGLDYTGLTASFICHDGKGNFLFAKRSQKCRDEQGAWEFGGGQIEFGEDPAEAVMREVKEEFNVTCKHPQFLGHTNLIRKHEGKTTHWLAFSFLIKVNPKQVKNTEPKSIDELKWCKLTKLPYPLHGPTKIFIKKFKKELTTAK